MNLIDSFLTEIIGKKIIVYGADATCLAFMNEAEKKGINVSYIVDGNKEKWGKVVFGKKVCNPYELLYEDKNQIKIVVCAPTAKDEISLFLEKTMEISKNNIILTYSNNRINCSHIDAMLGISRGEDTLVSMTTKSEVENDKTILILGGSTSDPYFDGIHSWSFYLNKLFLENGKRINIVNGAVVGYSTSQELLELIREGLNIKPDIVISYSGVNDYSRGNELEDGRRFSYVSRNLYNTINRLIECYEENEKKLPPIYFGEKYEDGFDTFIQNMRIMHSICTEYDIEFIGFYQPIMTNQLIKEETLSSRLASEPIALDFFSKSKKFYEKFVNQKNEYPYLVDFTKIFDKYENVFTDTCHTTEEGNLIIAKNIFDYLIKYNKI